MAVALLSKICPPASYGPTTVKESACSIAGGRWCNCGAGAGTCSAPCSRSRGDSGFQCAFEELASPKQALERTLLQEVAAQPDRSTRVAVVRAAGATGPSQTSVMEWAGLRISGALWKELQKRSKETSRFCRTTSRRQKALHLQSQPEALPHLPEVLGPPARKAYR